MNDLIKIALHRLPFIFTRRREERETLEVSWVWLIALLFAENNNCALILLARPNSRCERSFATSLYRWHKSSDDFVAQWSQLIVIVAAMDLMNQHDVGLIKGKTNQKTWRTLSHADETADVRELHSISEEIEFCTECSCFCVISNVIV